MGVCSRANLPCVPPAFRVCHKISSAGLRMTSILAWNHKDNNSWRRHHVPLEWSFLAGLRSPQFCTRRCVDDLSLLKRMSGCRDATAGEFREGDANEEVVPLKIAVGPTGNCCEQVTLPKPLGIVFQSMDRDEKEYVIVEQLVPRSNADRSSRVAQMFYSGGKRRHGNLLVGGDIRPRDVLRASTTVGVVVDLFGLRAPRRVVMLFRADGRPWNEVMAALNSSFVADGPVTLVLERPAPDLPP